jgi:hypothetical protein
VIYVVVPPAMADKWLEPLKAYYAGDPNVEVILDRREGERRARGSEAGGKRTVRDRRRARIPGSFPPVSTH